MNTYIFITKSLLHVSVCTAPSSGRTSYHLLKTVRYEILLEDGAVHTETCRRDLVTNTIEHAKTNDATTNECDNELFLSIKSGCYNESGGILGRCSTRVRLTCRASTLRLERQSLSLLSFVRFSYQFSSVICLFGPLAVKFF